MDLDALVAANRAIRRISNREIARLWATLDVGDVERTKAVLLDVMPQLVAEYGDMAATVAADLYEEWRAAAQAGRGFNALLAQINPEAVAASTRYALDPLFRDPPDPAAVLGWLQRVTDRHAHNAGRETIALNIAADPAKPRWARVPIGETCEWCLMLGSRGFSAAYGYTSELTAAAGSHDDCDCEIVPEWATGRLMDSYDPAAVRRQWRAVRAEREAREKAAEAAK